MDKERLREMCEEAIIDCYDEEEEFAGVLATLQDHLDFPLRAESLGVPVEVVALDEEASDLRRGIVARVRRAGKVYPVSLADLRFVDPDPDSAAWLAMYHWWLDPGEGMEEK